VSRFCSYHLLLRCPLLFCVLFLLLLFSLLFFFIAPAPPEIYTLSLHDALPILMRLILAELRSGWASWMGVIFVSAVTALTFGVRSEEHTSELQSRFDLVCRLLLEKKK